MPNIVGGSRLPAELKARKTYASRAARGDEALHAPVEEPVVREKRGELEARQNTNGQCGPGFGNCAPGYCCSSAG